MGTTRFHEGESIFDRVHASVLARNPKTILRNTDIYPILRGLSENRAKTVEECSKQLRMSHTKSYPQKISANAWMLLTTVIDTARIRQGATVFDKVQLFWPDFPKLP